MFLPIDILDLSLGIAWTTQRWSSFFKQHTHMFHISNFFFELLQPFWFTETEHHGKCGAWKLRHRGQEHGSWTACACPSVSWRDQSSGPEQCWKRAPGWLFDIWGWNLPNYMGIVISQYKDPYKPISIMECHRGFLTLLTWLSSRLYQKESSTSFFAICPLVD